MTPNDERLRLFRAEFPSYVSWAEVRAEDPRVFRRAATGGALLVPVFAVTLVASMLTMEFPAPVVFPASGGWFRGFLTVVLLWVALMGWVFVFVLVSAPHDVRRGIRLKRFATERGLNYAAYCDGPAPRGLLLAEGPPASNGLKPISREAQMAQPRFTARFALWSQDDYDRPSVKMGIASYHGSKDDAAVPRTAFRYLQLTLPRSLPHLVIDSRMNGSLRTYLVNSQRISLEGDFDRHFTVYAPGAYAVDALQLLTPDVMACLIDHGRSWDMEIVEDQLTVASKRVRASADREEYTALLRFAELIGHELGHQAGTYSDPRSNQPWTRVAAQGQRLRRRPAFWSTAIVLGAGACILGFPLLLGWLLDR